MLRWCSPANHFGLSSRRLGFESRSEHFLYLKDFLGISFPLLSAGVSERPKETGLGPVDAGLPGFESLLPHNLLFFSFYSYLGIHVPGQGRRSSYGTVDPVTRVQISAPAPFLNSFYYFYQLQGIFQSSFNYIQIFFKLSFIFFSLHVILLIL